MLELWTLWALLVLYALLRASFGAMRATGPGLFKHIGPTLVLPLASLSCMQQSLLDFAPFYFNQSSFFDPVVISSSVPVQSLSCSSSSCLYADRI